LDEEGAENDNPATYTILKTPVTLKDPVRPGYTFSGWYAYDEEKEDFVETTGIEEGGTGDRVFRAKWGDGDDWETPDTYSIEYENVDDATNPSENPNSYTILDTPIWLKNPIRHGYTFSGWYAYDEEEEDFVQTWGVEEGGVGDRVFRAKWGDGDDWDTPNTYTITYHNVNVTTNPNQATYTILDTKDEGLALQGLTGRAGYTFTGWYADAGYTTLVTGIEINGLEDRDYWAKWGDGGPDNPNKPDTYTITYQNLNGATNPNPATYTIIDTPRTLRAPTRAGYTFEGWYADAAHTTPVTRIDGTGNRIFWARWGSDADTYEIIYHNVNGATNPNPTSYNIHDTEGAGLALQGLTGRAGYTFTGWYADPDYTIPVTNLEPGLLEVRDYWAKWGDGGSDNPNKPDKYTITYHVLEMAYTSTYTIIDTPLTLKPPTLPGDMAFGGWFIDSNYSEEIKRLAEGTTGNLEFWAVIAMP
jgi:uncharacterized repeat protein (TIGR02543 family)